MGQAGPRHCVFPFWLRLSPLHGRVLGVGAATLPPRPGRPRAWCCGLPTWSALRVGAGVTRQRGKVQR